MAQTSLRVVVKSITLEAERINSYALHHVNDEHLPPFTAGAHVDLHLAEGITRSYSLTNNQSERHRYVIAVRREAAGRGGSAHVHDRLKAGDILTISAPRNNFAFDETGRRSIFVAGGIGVTPIVSMIRRAAELGHPWTIHYASRTRRDAAFLGEIEGLARASGGEVNAAFDHEAGGGALDIPAIIAATREDAQLYCCGPLPMLETFREAAKRRPPRSVHLEYFSAREQASTAGGFDVHLQKTGRTIAVPRGQSILTALLDAGINVAYACSEGTCGTCETRLLEGVPDHRDVYLSDDERAENKHIMICCSGAKTPVLVLDL